MAGEAAGRLAQRSPTMGRRDRRGAVGCVRVLGVPSVDVGDAGRVSRAAARPIVSARRDLPP